MASECGAGCEFIALDLETTGLWAAADRIVEIAAVRFRESGEVVETFQSLVNPERLVSPGAYAVHGITDQELAQAPRASDVLPELLAFLGNAESAAIVAHNASFDAGFLGTELKRAGLGVPSHAMYDTLALARKRLPLLESHRLESVARHFGLDAAGVHRAMADTLLVKEIWLRLGGYRNWDHAISFRMYDSRERMALPDGWEALERAVARRVDIWLEYEGGSRGTAPRSVSPRRLESRGGSAYLVAYCHLDALEKSFRVDRIRAIEFTSETDQEVVRVERRTTGG